MWLSSSSSHRRLKHIECDTHKWMVHLNENRKMIMFHALRNFIRYFMTATAATVLNECEHVRCVEILLRFKPHLTRFCTQLNIYILTIVRSEDHGRDHVNLCQLCLDPLRVCIGNSEMGINGATEKCRNIFDDSHFIFYLLSLICSITLLPRRIEHLPLCRAFARDDYFTWQCVDTHSFVGSVELAKYEISIYVFSCVQHFDAY